jgi:acyl carrier protein
MLEPGMALDTDLGIDSIKRVEILAAVRERVPVLPEFETSVMAGLRTLGEIVAYMDAQLGQTPAAAPPQSPINQSPIPQPHSVVAPPVVDLHAVMMAVVTEKTGYPTEMLEPGMALDTDLGIDSIKRVEILAAVRERVPDCAPSARSSPTWTPSSAKPRPLLCPIHSPFTIHHSPFTIPLPIPSVATCWK